MPRKPSTPISEHTRWTKSIFDRANYRATRQLIENHRMEFEIMKHAFVTEIKHDEGWHDARAEANREKGRQRSEHNN